MVFPEAGNIEPMSVLSDLCRGWKWEFQEVEAAASGQGSARDSDRARHSGRPAGHNVRKFGSPGGGSPGVVSLLY